MRTLEHGSPSAKFIADYERAEFRSTLRQAVLDALRDIDEARSKLVRAQNELAELLEHSNDFTRDAFRRFYAAGGVTAHDVVGLAERGRARGGVWG